MSIQSLRPWSPGKRASGIRALLAAIAHLIVGAAIFAAGTGGAAAAEDPRCARIEALFPSTTSEAAARHMLANITFRSFSPSHGNQVELETADGRAFLWYPGNRVILPGNWKLERKPIDRPREALRCSKPMLQLCFKYGSNTYNPVTGSQGAEWECEPFALSWSKRREIVPGDPLGLARMSQPPFPLERTEQSIAAIKARLPR